MGMNTMHQIRRGRVEYRSNGRLIFGYAAKWNSPAEIYGFVEVLSPYCFDLAASTSVLLNYDHETSEILDRTDGGTLKLRQDDVGLHFEAMLPKRSPKIDVDGLIEQIERKVLRSCSFAFDVAEDGERWGRTADGRPLRTVTRAKLYDVCITPCPAYPDTEVSVRRRDAIPLRRSIEDVVRRLEHASRVTTLAWLTMRLRQPRRSAA